jgi:glutathione peroxidase
VDAGIIRKHSAEITVQLWNAFPETAMLHRPHHRLLACLVLFLGLMAASSLAVAAPSGQAGDACPKLLQYTFPTLLDEKPTSLCEYAGKVILVVNTASYCGFTPQYQGLETLYADLRARGLVVLGFPSNDFGSQEPGSNKQIAEFCAQTYGVKFPMFAKTAVSGRAAHPFFQSLAQQGGQALAWNFHKYLIDRSGRQVVSFGSRTEPTDRRLLAQIESFLARPQP